jgi:phosphopantothenoylcysteine decarboxylase
MASFGSSTGNVLYLGVCAAPPARQARDTVGLLQDDGWDVCVIATPSALAWIEPDVLECATGHPVRSRFRGPDDPEFDPRGDALLVAPITFNTINSVTVGINDTLMLGLANEALGLGLPMAMVPWLNHALANHPAYERSVTQLRATGARILPPDVGTMDAFAQSVRQASRWLRAR